MSARSWSNGVLVVTLLAFGCGEAEGGGEEDPGASAHAAPEGEAKADAAPSMCGLFEDTLDDEIRAALERGGFASDRCMPKGNGSAIQFTRDGTASNFDCNELIKWSQRIGACATRPTNPTNWTCATRSTEGFVLSAMCTPDLVQMTLMTHGVHESLANQQ